MAKDKKPITSIDKHQLDEELARHSDDLTEWNGRLVEAEAELKDCETELELVEAEIADAIRRDPTKYGQSKSKMSEAMINKLTPMQQEYKDAVASVNRLKKKVGQIKVITKGLENKRTMLENLVKLWLAGYFGDVRVPKDARELMQQRDNDKLRVGIAKRRKT